jgi:hypothetical protein
MILCGAVTFALCGGAAAQTASPTDTQNSQTQQAKPAHSRTAHHYRHRVMRHRIAKASRETATEVGATRNLNVQQLQAARYGGPAPQYRQGAYMHGGYVQGAYVQGQPVAPYPPPGPGYNTGLTPPNRLPNGNPLQSATPAGGHNDNATTAQNHRS